MDGDMIFSNNPADYNRVVCMACGAKVKVKLFMYWQGNGHMIFLGPSYEETS